MARKEKVTESTTTLQAQPQPGQPREFETAAQATEGTLEIVDEPGPVKKIVFEATAPPPTPVDATKSDGEGEFQMAVPQGRPTLRPQPSVLAEKSSSLYTIREEVDQLRAPDASFAGAPKRANLRPWRSSQTVYRTEHGGEVRAYEGPNGRTLTLADGHQERRFSEAEVDRVIAGVQLEERTTQTTTETVTEPAPVAEEPKAKRGFFGLRRKAKTPAPEPEPAAPAPAAQEYQPQCSGLTEEGLQCRNSARAGSKYCSSHFGYQPRTVQGIHESRDTTPRFESSRDTTPGAGWDPSLQASAQCTAVTKGGLQCQNPVVSGSPYCGSHQSYTEPTHSEIVGSVDTKPRWSQAKDTKPSTRKASAPARKASKGKK